MLHTLFDTTRTGCIERSPALMTMNNNDASITGPELGLDVSHLLKDSTNKKIGRSIGEIEVRPKEQCYMSLGIFSKENSPNGFTANFIPYPQDDTIITRITKLDSNRGKYKLILHIANYGDETVSAELRQL